MFVEFEKRLINKGYIPLLKSNKIFSYYLKNDKTKQINIQESNNVYTFSFPINDIHYSTKFYDKISLFQYADYILNQPEFILAAKS